MSENLESLYNVKKIEEIANKSIANSYLELGWKLLKILQETRGTDNVAVYCVGWCFSKKPKYPKIPKVITARYSEEEKDN